MTRILFVTAIMTAALNASAEVDENSLPDPRAPKFPFLETDALSRRCHAMKMTRSQESTGAGWKREVVTYEAVGKENLGIGIQIMTTTDPQEMNKEFQGYRRLGDRNGGFTEVQGLGEEAIRYRVVEIPISTRYTKVVKAVADPKPVHSSVLVFRKGKYIVELTLPASEDGGWSACGDPQLMDVAREQEARLLDYQEP